MYYVPTKKQTIIIAEKRQLNDKLSGIWQLVVSKVLFIYLSIFLFQRFFLFIFVSFYLSRFGGENLKRCGWCGGRGPGKGL